MAEVALLAWLGSLFPCISTTTPDLRPGKTLVSPRSYTGIHPVLCALHPADSENWAGPTFPAGGTLSSP